MKFPLPLSSVLMQVFLHKELVGAKSDKLLDR